MPNDIYDSINTGSIEKNDPQNTDKIEERNTLPEHVAKEKDITPSHDKLSTRVDFFQEHPSKIEFNDTNGLLSFYDPKNPDRQYMDIIEQEAIVLSSPPIKYYRLIHLGNNIDPIYGEAVRRDSFKEPIIIYGNYEDSSFEQSLSKFGINQTETLDIWFNLNYILNTVGGIIQTGDIFETYDSKLWEVMSSLVIDESLWRAQHNNVKVHRIQPQGIFLPDYDGKFKSSVHEEITVPCQEPEPYEFSEEKEMADFQKKLAFLKSNRSKDV